MKALLIKGGQGLEINFESIQKLMVKLFSCDAEWQTLLAMYYAEKLENEGYIQILDKRIKRLYKIEITLIDE